MFWFDKSDSRVLFGDVRDESWELCDGRRFEVKPDMLMDYRDLPFPDETQIPVSQILKLTDHKPLFGNKQPNRTGTHWIVFIKEDTE